jgi:hypothetical protein
MNRQSALDTDISRRSFLSLAVAGLTGCGGGLDIGVQTAMRPGTGGTGLFVQGSISGFGSVIVNGIRFDDTSATVQLDGILASAQDLRLGMVVDVQGSRGADLTLGVANAIEVWSIAQGVVSQVQGGQFKVAGMLVQADAATVFDGVSSAAALVNGMRVAVWGLQSGIDGGRWTATRVSLVSATAVVCTGIVSVVGTLNGLALSGAKAASLIPGQLVRVQGQLSPSGTSVQVDSFKLLGLQSGSVPQGDVEIEGLVTALLSGSRFMLGNVEVDASSASLVASYKALSIGQRIEVEGIWQGQVLKAVLFEVESEQVLDEADIEARIEQFASIANFVVRGQRCNASSAVISKGVAADLKVGVKVKLRGTKAGDVLMVTALEIDN